MTMFQPTILVKKTDGTSVRMTMDEFRAYQKNIKTFQSKAEPPVAEKHKNSEVNEKGKEESEKLGNLSSSEQDFAEAGEIEKLSERKTDLPMKVETEALATSAPVKEFFVDEAKYIRTTKDTKLRNTKANVQPKWTKDDHKSLLEEEAEETREVLPTPAEPDDKLEQILLALNWKLPAPLFDRLRSLILSRIKDIRNDDQIAEYVLRPVDKGGLGLREEQARALSSVLDKYLKTGPVTGRARQPASLSKITKVEAKPATPVYPPLKKEQKIGYNTKPVLQDVTLSPQTEKKTVGPLEEFKLFSLVDFRRLANNPAIAARILEEKLQALQAESFLRYLQAVAAWRQSPLYGQYQQVIKNALLGKRRIQDFLAGSADKQQLRWEEFKALVEFNYHLTT